MVNIVQAGMRNNTLITLLLSVFIALLGIGIIIPIMPIFAAELGADGFSLGMIIAALFFTGHYLFFSAILAFNSSPRLPILLSGFFFLFPER